MNVNINYYIVYNPLPYNVLDTAATAETPIDIISYLTQKDAHCLNRDNYLDFLTLEPGKQRAGLAELLTIESYAALYIANQAAKLDPGSKVVLADGKRRKLDDIIREMGKPRAVFITSMSSTFPTTTAVSIVLNHAEIPVVIGGIHVSAIPDDVDTFIRPHVPHPRLISQVRGAGDSTVLRRVMADLKKDSLKPDYIGHVAIEDGVWGEENIIPMEPLKMFFLKKIPIIGRFMANNFIVNPIAPFLGCPYSCRFCSISTLPGDQREFRKRSPGDFIAELEHYQKDGVNGRNRIYFLLPDNLLLGGKTLEEMLDLIIERKLKVNLASQVSIDAANNERLLKKLRLAGTTHFIIGYESLDLRNLESIGKANVVRDIKKSGLSVKEYYARQTRKIMKYGMAVVGSFMFGLPYDYFHSFQDNTLEDVIAFCKENKIGIQPTCLTDVPGSPDFEDDAAVGKLLYGEPGTLQYLIGLSATDMSESNREVPASLKGSPLITSYMAYEAARRIGTPLNALKNGFFLAGRAWKYPTRWGKHSLFQRAYEMFLAFGASLIDSLYYECFHNIAHSKNGVRGSMERLYMQEKDPEVKAVFKDYVKKFY